MASELSAIHSTTIIRIQIFLHTIIPLVYIISLSPVLLRISSARRVGNSMRGQDFLVDQLGTDNMDGAKSVSVDSWRSKRALISFMGRINYGLMDKYLLTLSYRADGSSVFGENNKWGYFPSGSLAWRISQEDFLKDSPVVTDLKLRVSYGITGNQGYLTLWHPGNSWFLATGIRTPTDQT